MLHRSRLWRRLLLAALCVFIIGLALLLSPSRRDPVQPISRANTVLLEGIIVPKAHYFEATMEEVIAELNKSAVEAGASGLCFGTYNPTSLPKEVAEQLQPSITTDRISVLMTDVSMSELLRYVSGLFQCTTLERDGMIVLVPGWEGRAEPLVTKFFWLHRETFAADPKLVLQGQGLRFGPSCSARVLFGQRLLEVTISEDQADIVDLLINGGCTFGAKPT